MRKSAKGGTRRMQKRLFKKTAKRVGNIATKHKIELSQKDVNELVKDIDPNDSDESLLIRIRIYMEGYGSVERRKVLFTDGLTKEAMLIITDAPVWAIEEQLQNHMSGEVKINKIFFDSLKEKYYVKLLYASMLENDSENIDIIGYDESYDFIDYCHFFD